MEFATRDPWDDLADAERDAREADRRRLASIDRIEARWPDDSCVPDLACELARLFGWSQHDAAERLRIAVAFRELPAIHRAQAEGRLSWNQLRWVTRFATRETDADWAARAPSMTPNQLRLESIRQVRLLREKAEREHAERYLWTGWDEEHRTLSIEGRLGAEQGAAFEEAIRAAAREVEADPDADAPRGARRADALMRLVISRGGNRQRPTLVVHADAEVVAKMSDGSRHLAETSGGIQVHAEAVRRMACMARVRVAMEREGNLIGLVSASRGPTDAQLEALWFRDRMCTFPGCEAKLFVEAHHIRHWADGGTTTLDNLTLLCDRHHRMLHEGGWTIRGRPPELEFVDRWDRVRTRAGPVLARAG
ncbi:MAG: DUF222 domain-containing protein [Actinomycetota bacterium]